MGAKLDLGKTMPLSNRASAAPALRQFSGTVPMNAVPEASNARVAALEAVRPSQPVAPPAPASAPHVSEPRVSQPRVSPAPAQPRPRSSRALTVVLLLFVLASLAASGLLFARLYLV